MGFVAAPPASSPSGAADRVAGDGWWPDLSVARFRAAVRLGTTVTDDRARDALIGGIVSAQQELARWRATRTEASLADIAIGPAVDGIARAALLYIRAVHAYAAADVTETHGEISATGEGRDRQAERLDTADDHRARATRAIRDLLGRRRSRVKLL